MANPQALNRYSYVMNRPVSFSDPTGHMQASDPYTSSDGKCKSGDTSCNWAGKGNEKKGKDGGNGDECKSSVECDMDTAGGGKPQYSPQQSGPACSNNTATVCVEGDFSSQEMKDLVNSLYTQSSNLTTLGGILLAGGLIIGAAAAVIGLLGMVTVPVAIVGIAVGTVFALIGTAISHDAAQESILAGQLGNAASASSPMTHTSISYTAGNSLFDVNVWSDKGATPFTTNSISGALYLATSMH